MLDNYAAVAVDSGSRWATLFTPSEHKLEWAYTSYAGVHHHVTGALCHGFGQDFAFTWTDCFHPDANVTINCLMKVLYHVKEANDGVLPPVLYLQADNSGKDNKNHFVLMFLASLVNAGIFRKVKLSFLMVGHTHEDVDQLFSRISVRLCQQNAVTLPSLHEAIKASSSPSPVTEHIHSLYDFKSKFIALERVEGIKTPHLFRFLKTESGVQLSIKDWPVDQESYRSVTMANFPSLNLYDNIAVTTKNPKIEGVVAAMSRDISEWRASGRVSYQDCNWWQQYLAALSGELPQPTTPLPSCLPIVTRDNRNQGRPVNPNTIIEAINRHISQFQASSEIRLVRPRR